MWITYSCQLGYDRTTALTERPTPRPQHCPNRRMVSKDIPLDSGRINIHCTGNCPIVINKAMAACNANPNPAAQTHLAIVKRLCEGKQRCSIAPTSAMFGVHCRGWRRMWITYSCQIGHDQTTINIKPQKPRPQVAQHCQNNRKMVSRDIYLDSGWIKIHCTGNCPIVINKGMAGCHPTPSPATAGHINIVKQMCEGRQTCTIRPTSRMFGVTCRCAGLFCFGGHKRRLWVTYSCKRGHDRTKFQAKKIFGIFG